MCIECGKSKCNYLAYRAPDTIYNIIIIIMTACSNFLPVIIIKQSYIIFYSPTEDYWLRYVSTVINQNEQ